MPMLVKITVQNRVSLPLAGAEVSVRMAQPAISVTDADGVIVVQCSGPVVEATVIKPGFNEFNFRQAVPDVMAGFVIAMGVGDDPGEVISYVHGSSTFSPVQMGEGVWEVSDAPVLATDLLARGKHPVSCASCLYFVPGRKMCVVNGNVGTLHRIETPTETICRKQYPRNVPPSPQRLTHDAAWGVPQTQMRVLLMGQ